MKPFDTWKCHICGEERPDERISVVTKPLVINGQTVGDQNIRYCNDRPVCIEGAKEFSFFKGKREGRMMETDAIVAAVASWGLFIAKLNSGDWMAGKASYIYRLDILQDHYADPNLSISPSLGVAVEEAVAKAINTQEGD